MILMIVDIYQNGRVTKSRAYLITQRAPGVYGLFNSIDKDIHQRKRRLLSHVLNDRAMRSYEPVMIAQIDIFLQQLLLSCGRGLSESVDMTQRFKYLALDIMGNITFGFPLNLQTETTHRTLVKTTVAHFFMNVAMQLPFVSQLRILTLRSLRSLVRGGDYLQSLHKMINHSLSKGQHVKRDLRFLSDNPNISEQDDVWLNEVRSEAIFFLTAGEFEPLSAIFVAGRDMEL